MQEAKEYSYLWSADCLGVSLMVENDEALDPVEISFLG
jgi:hypothetical protein